MCTASLVDAYAAMANTAEEHWRLAAAHPLYAALLEKTLAEVAWQQIAQLEALAQVSKHLLLLMAAAHPPNAELLKRTPAAPGPCTSMPTTEAFSLPSGISDVSAA